MDILYLSSLCSKKEYERMFNKFGSTSSHASQKFNRLMVNGFVENDCNVEALSQRITLSVDHEEHVRPEETEDGVHYKYLPCYKNKIANRIMTVLNAKRAIYKWQKAHKEGVVVCDILLGELSLAVWLASFHCHINTVAIVTDVPTTRAGEQRKGIRAIPYKIKNLAIRQYSGYIFLTEQMNLILNPKHKPYVVIEGIVDQHVLDEPNTIEGKHDNKTCMMAGLLEDIFGVSVLLEAFRQVTCPEARLVFYGKGSSVDKILEAGKNDSRICFCGELPNSKIVSEEKKATLLINPRPPIGEWTAYSFPSKNMEYIASGTPMLAYHLPCIPEEYLPYAFYVMESDDIVGGLKEKLEEILQKNTKDLNAFGKRAQEWIVTNKNNKVQALKAAQMMHQLLSKNIIY